MYQKKTVDHTLWKQNAIEKRERVCLVCTTLSLETYCLKFKKIKLMKGKALRKQGLHEKLAASVLLKLLISDNERCHTTDAP